MTPLSDALTAAQRHALATLDGYAICSRCHFDLTGEDEDSRREPEAPPRVEGPTE